MSQPISRWSATSIQWRLPLIVGGLLLVVILTLATAAYLQVSRVVEKAATERVQGVVAQLVEMLQAQSRQYAAGARRVGERPEIRDFLSLGDSAATARASEFLQTALKGDTAVTASVEILDRNGKRVLAEGRFADRVGALGHEDLLTSAALSDSGTVGRVQNIDSIVVVPGIARVVADSELIGYVVVWRRIGRNTRAREQFSRLIGEGGVLYFGSPDGAWTDQVRMTDPPPVDVSRITGAVTYQRPESGTRLASAARVPGTPWFVLMEFSRDTVLAPARQFVGGFAWVAALILLVGLVAAWLSSRHITGPLAEVTAVADAIRAGDHSVRAPAGRQDEIGRLSTAFNAMIDRVDEQETARAESEEQWRLLFEHNPHPMWVYDRESLRILRVNQAAVDQYGYTREEFETLTLVNLRAPEEVAHLRTLMATMGDDDRRVQLARHKRKDGSIISVETRGRPLQYPGHRARLVSSTDISDRTLLEEQLRQSQKMEAIGRLAGGVAHDFNNLLTVIGASAEMVGDADLDAATRASLNDVSAATARAAALTRQLLMFSRKQIVQRKELDLNHVVQNLEPMLSRLLFDNLQFQSVLSPDPVMVVADASQLEQVIVNLAVNASDAMPKGGSLTIETGSLFLDAAYAQAHAGVEPGNYAMLAVSDTGHGMDEATIQKIFEPFFTTKPVGEGTGLGLATVYGIVKELGGHVWVYSEPGNGATFKVYLPLLTASEAAAAQKEKAVTTKLPTGTETVLLVEDNTMVRVSVRRMLERSGYSVLEAANGREGLAMANGVTVPIHLVITDLMMPGMDGRSLAEALREAHDEVRVIFTSGYTDDAVTRRGLLDSRQIFLQKPFTVEQLARTVRTALDA